MLSVDSGATVLNVEGTRLTPNQIVAFNLRRARHLRNWTQAEAAERLEPYLGQRWSKATFSVAERSPDHADRIRQFTADDLIAFAAAFEFSVSFFLMPPAYVDVIGVAGASDALKPKELVELATAPHDDGVQALYEERIRELDDRLRNLQPWSVRPASDEASTRERAAALRESEETGDVDLMQRAVRGLVGPAHGEESESPKTGGKS